MDIVIIGLLLGGTYALMASDGPAVAVRRRAHHESRWLFGSGAKQLEHISAIFPVFFPVTAGIRIRDWFAQECVHHHENISFFAASRFRVRPTE
jgi:hypothetical protein